MTDGPLHNSIRERSPGVWEIRAYVGRDPITGKPRHRWATYRAARAEPGYGKREAERQQRKLQQQADEERPGASMTVAGLLVRWMEDEVRPRRAESTIAGYDTKVRGISGGPLGPVRLDRLTARDIDAWSADRLRNGWTLANLAAHHRVLRAALRTAERWDWIEHSPMRRIRGIVPPDPNTSSPTPAQLDVILQVAEKARARYLRSLLLFAVLTGMRRGEVCGLRWSHIDTEGRQVHVRRAVWQVNGRWGEKDPKGHHRRSIPLDPVAIDLLEQRYAECRGRGEAAGVPWREDGYVWAPTADVLTPLRPDVYSQAFSRVIDRVAKAHGGEWPFRLHDLRGMSATELVAGGMDIRTVASILGHDPRVLLDRYAHVVDERKREAVGVLARAVTPAVPADC